MSIYFALYLRILYWLGGSITWKFTEAFSQKSTLNQVTYILHAGLFTLGPITVVAGRARRVTFLECTNELSCMCDLARVADMILLVVDASYGFEMVYCVTLKRMVCMVLHDKPLKFMPTQCLWVFFACNNICCDWEFFLKLFFIVSVSTFYPS